MSKIGELIGSNLTRIRRAKKISKEALSHLVGVSRQTIFTYEEKGTGLANSEMIEKLAGALGIEESDLFLEIDDLRELREEMKTVSSPARRALLIEVWTAEVRELARRDKLKAKEADKRRA